MKIIKICRVAIIIFIAHCRKNKYLTHGLYKRSFHVKSISISYTAQRWQGPKNIKWPKKSTIFLNLHSLTVKTITFYFRNYKLELPVTNNI